MTPYVVALLIAISLVSFLKGMRLRSRLHEEAYQRACATAKLETVQAEYKALLARANELATQNVTAGRLVNEVNLYIGNIKDQLKAMLAVHHEMRRALEHIASFRGAVDGANYTETLKKLAADALPGLTLAGTVEEVAARMVKPSPFYAEAQAALTAAGGVAADGTGKVKVDLSGQAARIRTQLKETVSSLRKQFARPLDHSIAESPLTVAADRLETKKLAVDLVNTRDGRPGIAIVTEGSSEDLPRVGGASVVPSPVPRLTNQE